MPDPSVYRLELIGPQEVLRVRAFLDTQQKDGQPLTDAEFTAVWNGLSSGYLLYILVNDIGRKS